MFVNVIKSYRDVIAVCDKEILGKVFEEPSGAGDGVIKQLNVKENFYKGKETEELEVIEIMRSFSAEDATFNIVGQKSVAAAIKAGIITEETVSEIKGIPFALVLL